MPPASPDDFIPLFAADEPQANGRPVRLRVAELQDPVRPLSHWQISTGNGAAGARTLMPAHLKAEASTSPPGSESHVAIRRAPDNQCDSAPRLTVVRDGPRVVGIELRCDCGRVWNLLCEYHDPQGDQLGPSTPQGPSAASVSLPCPSA